MGERVLVATLGESPVVVTATYHLLTTQCGIPIDRVEIVYPAQQEEVRGPADREIEAGALLIVDHLDRIKVPVVPHGLAMPDTNTRERTIEFLQVFTEVLWQADRAGDEIYVLLAGGRKNMSALAAVAAGFFPTVTAVYHLIDTRERLAPTFLSIRTLLDLPETERDRRLRPDPDHLRLFKIPFGRVAGADRLLAWLADPSQTPRLPLQIDGDDFYERVLGLAAGDRLTVRMTETAYRQALEVAGRDHTRYRQLRRELMAMRHRDQLAARVHHKVADERSGQTFVFYDGGWADHRPLYYTFPDALGPDPWDPAREVREVRVIAFSVHEKFQSGGKEKQTYDKSAEEWIAGRDFEPHHELHDLPSLRRVLIAPLGLSPMVVPQAIELLADDGLVVDRVVLVYPGEHQLIAGAARWLRRGFDRRKRGARGHWPTCVLKPVDGLVDIDSLESAEQFARHLTAVIADEDVADDDLILLISGGRKPMAAMAVLAAQRLGLDRVYHTTIRQVEDERMIERLTDWEDLTNDGARASTDRVRLVFLEGIDHNRFALFPVPLLPIDGTS